MSTNSTIWMGDIEPKMTEHEIMNFFHKYNIKPQSIKLMKDKATNENKNYCFISFKTIKEANTALFRLNGKKIPGYSAVFRLNWASIRSPVNKSVYVGNLNPKVDDIKLYNLFKKNIQQYKTLPLLLIMEYQKDMDLYCLMEKKIMKNVYKK